MPLPLRTDVRGGQTSATWRQRVTTTLRTVIAALAATVVMTGAAHAATAPAGFTGIGDWNYPTASQAQQLGADGVGAVRAGLVWDWVEHTQGVRNWGEVDQLVQQAAAGHYELVLVINGCAAWACGQTRVPPTTQAQQAQFQDFVGAAVKRYGAGGSYWAANPGLAPARINWQVWNEVNVGADWPNPTTAGYAAMLSTTSATIKGIDPAARVVSAGLAELPAVPTGAPLSTFLAGLEREPGFQQAADVVAIHGYSADPVGVTRILDMTRRIMDAAGDNRPIWITELGWGSGGPAHPFAVDPATQASYLRQTFSTLVGCRARWNLDRTIWFALEDVSSAQLGEPDYWGMHTGLYNTDGSAKPAADAFREFEGGRDLPAGEGDSCPLPGGADRAAATASSHPPVVTIVKAPAFVGNQGSAQVNFVTDMGNAGRAECSLNGAAWAPCATPYVIPRTQEGLYALAIRAIDRTGTVSQAPAVAKWIVDLTPPHTVFKKKPPKRSTKRAVPVQFGTRTVRLGLASTEVVTFQCSLNKSRWSACQAKGRARTKRLGKQVLRVRAVDQAGNVDPRGAVARFTVAAAR